MSESWGFDLDISAIRLLRRRDGHWHEVAIERIDGPDIEDRLMDLVDQVAPNTPVDVFLPRDQILYTDIQIGSDDTAADDIEAAMVGRTPYQLHELQLDWIKTSDTTARVAAIAIETLDEAAAFAEARGLIVGSYSSLASEEDFPRLPDFGGNQTAFAEDGPASDVDEAFDQIEDMPEAEPAAASGVEALYPPDTSEIPAAEPQEIAEPYSQDASDPEPAVTFSSARKSSYPPLGEDDFSSGPVVKVEDRTPVMNVRTKQAMPLNPGAPLKVGASAPRIRTDIAASSVSGHAASLTPGPSIKLRNEGTGSARTATVFAVAALLTIGIAVIVWQLLPLRAGQTPVDPAETTGQRVTELPDTTQIATLPPEEIAEPIETLPEEEIATPEIIDIEDEETTVAAVVDLPVPDVATGVDGLGGTPEIAEADALLEVTNITPVAMPNLSQIARPFAADQPANIPAAPTRVPAGLAALPTTPPLDRLPFGDATDPTSVDIALAQIQPGTVFGSAVPLPDETAIGPKTVPQVGAAPALAVVAASTDAEGVADPTNEAVSVEAPEIATLAEPNIAEGETTRAEPLALLDGSAPLAEPQPDIVAETQGPDTTPEQLAEPEIEYVQTALARSLPDETPRARPAAIIRQVEQRKFGGLTREQLALRKPPPRPQSAQSVAEADRDTAPSEFAVATSAQPKTRPSNFETIVSATLSRQEAARITASLDFETPDTSDAVAAALAAELEGEGEEEPSPRPQDTPRLAIPSDASVARQATIDDAIRLNKVNLVGVYGVPSDRRALVRLPSGRYVKVKVGDRVDGGTVAQIRDSELIYRKGGRNIALTMPRS